MQLQIRNSIWTKNLGNRTIFEFDPKLLRVQTPLEKSDKFPNFLFDLTFQIVNLDWHGCMVKLKFPYKLHMTWFGRRKGKEDLNLNSTKLSSHAIDSQQLQDEAM
jgi:hypothetical protein